MATYKYGCNTCKGQFEVNKPMSESSTSERCHYCGDTNTVKLLYPVTIIYKGAGFTKSTAPSSKE